MTPYGRAVLTRKVERIRNARRNQAQMLFEGTREIAEFVAGGEIDEDVARSELISAIDGDGAHRIVKEAFAKANFDRSIAMAPRRTNLADLAVAVNLPPCAWEGRTGLRDLTVLMACLQSGCELGTLSPYLSDRTLSERLAGQISRATVGRSLASLVDEGWLIRLEDGNCYGAAARYKLDTDRTKKALDWYRGRYAALPAAWGPSPVAPDSAEVVGSGTLAADSAAVHLAWNASAPSPGRVSVSGGAEGAIGR